MDEREAEGEEGQIDITQLNSAEISELVFSKFSVTYPRALFVAQQLSSLPVLTFPVFVRHVCQV